LELSILGGHPMHLLEMYWEFLFSEQKSERQLGRLIFGFQNRIAKLPKFSQKMI
jgi:hypothetical protein